MRNTAKTNATSVERDCYVSLELSQKSWLSASCDQGLTRFRSARIAAGDTAAL